MPPRRIRKFLQGGWQLGCLFHCEHQSCGEIRQSSGNNAIPRENIFQTVQTNSSTTLQFLIDVNQPSSDMNLQFFYPTIIKCYMGLSQAVYVIRGNLMMGRIRMTTWQQDDTTKHLMRLELFSKQS